MRNKDTGLLCRSRTTQGPWHSGSHRDGTRHGGMGMWHIMDQGPGVSIQVAMGFWPRWWCIQLLECRRNLVRAPRVCSPQDSRDYTGMQCETLKLSRGLCFQPRNAGTLCTDHCSLGKVTTHHGDSSVKGK